MSDYEKVKQAASLKDYAEQFLAKSTGGLYCCPACGSGTHGTRASDGALGIYSNGEKWKCFSCAAGGDIFDLAGIVNKTDDKAEQLRIVAEWARIPLEEKRGGFKSKMNADKAAGATESAHSAKEEQKGTDTPEPDYTAGRAAHRRYIAECAQRMREQPNELVDSYLSARGISRDEAVALGIGYDLRSRVPWTDADGNKKFGARIVLPWLGNDYYHVDRATDENAKDAKYTKPKADDVGEQPVYNPSAFDRDYVVVVEGVLDAIAVQLCGYNAVALGGTGVNDFVSEAARRKYAGVVIDMLDADGVEPVENQKGTKGRGAGASLVSLLAEAGVTTLARAEYGIGGADDYAGHKDAGEYLADNRADLAAMLEYMRVCAGEKKHDEEDAAYRELLRSKTPEKVPYSTAKGTLLDSKRYPTRQQTLSSTCCVRP